MNDKALIKRCQRGDRQAFDELIRLYYDYVSGFLLKNTGDETLSEDLTQATFFKMIRSIEKYDTGGSASFGTWLITICGEIVFNWKILILSLSKMRKRSGRGGEKVPIRANHESLGNASVGTGSGNQAEICGGHDPRANSRAFRSTAKDH